MRRIRGKWMDAWIGRGLCSAGIAAAGMLIWWGSVSSAAAQPGAQRYGRDIYWNATPNDVNNLLKAMRAQLDVHYHMDIRTIAEISPDPEQNPVLYRSGHYRFTFTPAERQLLREYLLNGGMILFNTGLGSEPFYRSAVRELAEIFPEQPLQRLSADHPIFHAYYDVDQVEYTPAVAAAGYQGNQPWFDAVEINCRVVALVSRWGLAVGWEGAVEDDHQAYRPESAYRLGLNIMTYAAAMRAWTKSSAQAMRFIDDERAPTDTVALAQVIYDGVWKTRHAGMSVLLQTFNRRTGVPVQFALREMRLTDPDLYTAPLLYLTGHEAFEWSPAEVTALRRYLENGGILFAEACCGRKGFDQAFRANLRRVLPGHVFEPLPADSPLFREPNDVRRVSVTPPLIQDLGAASVAPRMEGIELHGYHAVLYSPFGLAGGWEMSQSPYARGLTEAAAVRLGQNILMYSLTH